MPRYLYECQHCFVTSSFFHMMNETIRDCDDCGTADSLAKQLGVPVIIKEHASQQLAVGNLTHEYIELNRQLLEEEKKRAIEDTHEPT